jgi:uncharacterized protein YndB with AHSA1/START domain
MRVEQSFDVARAPEDVFDLLTDPARLAEWQTAKTRVEKLTDGPPGLGTRVRETTRQPGGREFDQIVEFTKFERPRLVHVHVVEGPYPVDGEWAFEPQGGGTRVRFVAEGELSGAARLMQPIVRRIVTRQFAGYHENLRRLLESA